MLNLFFWRSCPRKLGQLCQKNSFNTIYSHTSAITSNIAFFFFSKGYKAEILLPVLQSVARRLGQGDMYEGIALDTDPLVMPRGASEIEVRAKQVCPTMV